MTILTGDFVQDAKIAGLTAVALPEGDSSRNLPSDEAEDNSDLRLYRRHIEGGESIRALARETGHHASTILRRIRRFEARRDDPLVDAAVDAMGAQPSGEPGPNGLKQVRRVLRRLAEPGAMLVVADSMEKAIVIRDDIRTAILDRQLAGYMAVRGWVRLTTQGKLSRYAISSAGRDVLRNAMGRHRAGHLPMGGDLASAEPVGCAEAAMPFSHADQHRVWDDKVILDPEDGTRRRTRVNIAESPLLMLARRRESDGKPFLAAELVAAGERLREDYELAQMGPRVTQNWDAFLTSGIDVSRHGSRHNGGSDGARNRVAAALRELGPGMDDMCLRVCCFLEGIEMTERRLGWSARSGKIVLRLALMRLDRHYRDTYGAGAPLIG